MLDYFSNLIGVVVQGTVILCVCSRCCHVFLQLAAVGEGNITGFTFDYRMLGLSVLGTHQLTSIQ